MEKERWKGRRKKKRRSKKKERQKGKNPSLEISIFVIA